MDKTPWQVHAILLERGEYLCSPRTMYRILEAEGEVRERRNQRRHPRYEKPRLVATAPNQVWSWDITKLRGPNRWELFYLYVILDLFSRYVVGWMLARRECSRLVGKLFEETSRKEQIESCQLVVHADRGSVMRSGTTLELFERLSITPSFSRPRMPDDNPYSESQFKTLKYHVDFPTRFSGYEHGVRCCRRLFDWYNTEHRHSRLAYLTPEMVHRGVGDVVLERRAQTLRLAHEQHPERFVNGRPAPRPLANEVWINDPTKEVTIERR